MNEEAKAALSALLKAIEKSANALSELMDTKSSAGGGVAENASQLIANAGPVIAELRQMTGSKQDRGL